MRKTPHRKGFTLIELMVVVAVAAILVTLAYPSYLSTVRKARRTEAIEALYVLQLAQEKWRAVNPAYGTLSDIGVSSTTENGYYNLSVTLPAPPNNQTSYTATASAVGGTSQTDDKEGDVSCAVLKVDQNGPVYDPAGQTACWKK